MTAFPKYPAYKPSGVEWLGDVPEDWNAEKGKWLFNLMERPPRKEDEIVTAFRDGQVTLRINRRTEGFTNAIKEHGYQGIRKGDLVIHAMDAFAGAIGVSDSDGKSTPVYSACVPRKQNSVNPHFYAYLLRHMAHSGFITTLAKGIRERSTNFSFTDFAALRIPLPPKLEQDRIVAFLDEKTAQIDALIAKKQRQIELLDEQRGILINRAVTRGIGNGELRIVNEVAAEAASDHSTFTIQNSQFKDSGIPWIGPIPKHWRVVPIKRMASVQNGVTLGHVYPVNMSSEVPYLRVANVQNGSLNLNLVATLRLPRRVAAKYLLQSGDVLVAEGGDLDKLGRGCVWRAELPYCIHQNHVFAVRTEAKRLLPEFLSAALGSRYGQRYFMLTGKQTTNLASTNSTSLMNFPLATPPLEEQERIMDELARTQTAFERARNAFITQIQTLQTLRSTLIAHAVTGKIAIPAATA